jgi:divalent metal cation (Fe/Co/Zn/Cd) transporter
MSGNRPLLQGVRRSKDPTVFTVLFEDTAAILGLIIAAVGIELAQAFHMPKIDAIASIFIGVILAGVAAPLAFETKGLLIGEAAIRDAQSKLCDLTTATPGILATNELLTMHLGPQDILVNVSLDFEDHLTSAEVEATISELERRIINDHSEVRRIFIEAQSLSCHAANADT